MSCNRYDFIDSYLYFFLSCSVTFWTRSAVAKIKIIARKTAQKFWTIFLSFSGSLRPGVVWRCLLFKRNVLWCLADQTMLRKNVLKLVIRGKYYFLLSIENNTKDKLWTSSRTLFVYFRPFLITISIIQIETRIDGVLGIRTRSRRMVGADKTTKLCRPACLVHCFSLFY